MKARTWIACVALCVASYLFYKKIDSPMLWLFPTWSALAVGLAIKGSSDRGRWWEFNLFLVLSFLTIGEYWMWMTRSVPQEGQLLTPKHVKLHVDHPSLGYIGHPSVELVGSQAEDGQIVFRVKYTMNEHGFRKMPELQGAGKPLGCMLFLGGSQTFGVGVEDDETLPARAQALGEGHWQAYNFGISGYGTHQALALIQEGHVDRIIDCEPQWVIYQHIHDHVRRAAGWAPWDPNGPRFEIDEAGNLVRMGQFDRAARRRWLRKLGKHSYLVERLISSKPAIGTRERDRFFGMLDQLESEIATRWPGAEFSVITWAERDAPQAERFLQGSVQITWVVDALPGANDLESRWRLARREHHPNAAAYAELAEILMERVMTSTRGSLPRTEPKQQGPASR